MTQHENRKKGNLPISKQLNEYGTRDAASAAEADGGSGR
jgi:hypothetical protein